MKKPEIDQDALFEAAYSYDSYTGQQKLLAFIGKLVDQAYEAGRRDVLSDGAARHAMLAEQSHWLDRAAKAGDDAIRAIAQVVSDAFGNAATQLRAQPRPTLDEPTGEVAGETVENLEVTNAVHK